MSTYTWKIQFSEHYPDQFVTKGAIDKEKAVEEFQLFPWDKEIDDYKRRNDNPTIPKIIFNSDDQRQLIIESTSNNGYNAEYTNLASHKCSDFYISNNFEKKNFAPEEIIEFFFDNNLEEHLNLEDIPKQDDESAKEPKERKIPKNVEFDFDPQHFKTLGFLTFLYLGISITLYIIDHTIGHKLPLFFHFILALAWIPSFVLHITYCIKNNSSKVIIDTKNHELTYIKGSKSITFNRDDIFRCQITMTASSRASWDNYSYVWFILNDRTYVSITCLMADPYKIVEALNCKYEEKERTLPLLPI